MGQATSSGKQKKPAAGGKLLLAAGLLLLAAIAQYIYFNWASIIGGGQTLRMTDTQKGVAYEYEAGTSFYSYDSRFFYFCTKDGVKYVASDGNIKWQEIFNLSKPLMAARGDTVAMGEAKGKHIYVFNGNGPLFDAAFDEPALFFSVNKSGYLAVILKLDKGYEVRVYYRQGDEPIYRNVLRDPLMQPMAVDISDDGRYVALALLDISLRMSSRASFYYVNAKDAYATADGLFAWEDFPNQLIGCIQFMDKNNALVVTDTQINCYRPDENHSLAEQWTLPMRNRIDYLAFYNGSRFAFTTGDKLLNTDNAAEPGTVYIYGINGECTGEFNLGRKATYLSMGHDAVLVGADRSFYALNNRGIRLWEYITTQDTGQLIFLDNTDTVLMSGGARATVLKRTKQKNGPPAYMEGDIF
jgi:hypothetical protein